jgi:hypothetical protein
MRSALAGLALGVALAPIGVASADQLTLTPPPTTPVFGTSTPIGVIAVATAPTSVFLYAHPLGMAPCGLTANDEAGLPVVLSLSPSPYPVPAGTTGYTASFLTPGPATICGYMATTAAAVPTAIATIPLGGTSGPVAPTIPVVPPSVPVTPELDPNTDPKRPSRTPRGPTRVVSRLHRHMFGTNPLPISVGGAHQPANGDSGGAAVSGDNRKTRLAAFHSSATNLVGGDTNGATDVFVWQRPPGRAGLVLNHLGGALKRVSVSSGGDQANGDSTNPSLDGSIRSAPHCVAFESTATNLAGGDHDRTSDIYVRDLRSNRTFLASAGVGPAATHPSLDGRCQNVAFEAGGSVWQAPTHGGRAHRVAAGGEPDYSLDGSAIVWARGGNVWIRRRGVVGKVGPGSNPRVSDDESGIWGIVFDTRRRLTRRDHDSRVDVYTRVVKRRGGPSRTDLISTASGSDAYNGGITAYGANRGIIVFGIDEGRGSGLWYRNNNTGNIDDLAFTTEGALQGIATSARANFVAFTAAQAISPLDRSTHTDVFFKHLVDGESY